MPIFANGCGGSARTTSGYVPWHFELSFGLGRRNERRTADPQSVPGAVDLDCGIQLRGSIDLVERHPSGRCGSPITRPARPGKSGQLVDGGKSLQPLLYALAAEKLFAGEAEVEGGRLYFCTSAGGFAEQIVPLDGRRGEPPELADDDRRGARRPFLPAAPDKGQCDCCDYQVVCGPYEERRTARKPARNARAAPRASGAAMTDLPMPTRGTAS